MAEQTKDPMCAVCGKPIECGKPRYRVVVGDELASAHVECHRKRQTE